MTVEITVRGEAEERFTPERAVVTLTAAVEESSGAAQGAAGHGRDEVYARAVAIQQAITAQTAELVEQGAAATWSSDQVAVTTFRPWRDNGTQGPPVHVARVGVVVEFVDFDRLGGFVDEWAAHEGVELGGIAWDVTPASRRSHEAALRTSAVADAIDRAQVYADALNLGRVSARRVADAGLLDSGSGPAPMMFAAKAFDASGSDGAGVRLTPEPVVIHVAVDAAFGAE